MSKKFEQAAADMGLETKASQNTSEGQSGWTKDSGMSRGFYQKSMELGLISPSSSYAWSADRGMSRSFDEARRKLGLYTVEYDTEDYVNSFLSDYNAFYDRWGSSAQNAGWSDAMSGSERMRTEYGSLQQRGNSIRDYLNRNKDAVNPDYYDEVMANLDTADSGYQELQDEYNSLSQYYGQWGSQEEYDSWMRDYEALQEAERQAEEAERQNEQYRQNQQRLQELQLERDRLQISQNGQEGQYMDAGAYAGYQAGTAIAGLLRGEDEGANNRRLQEINDEIAQLQTAIGTYEESIWGAEGHVADALDALASSDAPASDGMTAEDREQRIAEIESQMKDLQMQNSGAERGLAYDSTGNLSRRIQENDQKIAELEEERRALLLAGASTQRESLGYQRNFAAADYAAASRQMQSTARTATTEAITATKNAARSAAEANAELSRADEMIDWLDYVDEYSGKKYADNFFGQFGANYTLGRMSMDSSLYWNAYLDNPTEENRRMAETADELVERFSVINSDTLADDGTLPWISRDLANYVPQFLDQLKYKAGGALAGASLTLGNPHGAKAGYTAGSALYGYQTMRGAAFRELVKAGMDEDTARAAARDEGLISSAIEAGDAIIELATMGGGKVIDLITDGGASALKKLLGSAAGKNAATKFLTALGKYVLNAGQEYVEESTQEAVSIANQERGTSGLIDLAGRALETYLLMFAQAETEEEQAKKEQMQEAGMGGLRLGLMLGGGEMIGNATVGRAVGNLRAEAAVGGLRPQLQELTEKTLELNPGDKNALTVQKKLENGKKVSGLEIYNMLVANENGAAKKDAQIVREAVTARLTELGETGDVESIAEVIARHAAGEELRRRDWDVVRDSKYGQRVINELSNAESGDYSSEWVRQYDGVRRQSMEYANDLSGSTASSDVQQITNRLIREGVNAQEAGETAGKLAEAGRVYGKQADVFTRTYLKGQSVEQYRMAYANIYQAGKDGVSRELIQGYGSGLTDTQKEIAYLAGQEAASGAKAAQGSKEADTADVNAEDVNAEGKTIRTDTGEDIEPTGFESVGENGTLTTKGGQSVSIRSVSFASFEEATLYKTIAKVSSSANIANTLLRQFRGQDSLSAIDFSAALMEAYDAGRIGDRTVRELADAEFAGKLNTGQREVIYNRGKRMGYKDAYRRQNGKKNSGGKKEGALHFDRKGRTLDAVRESSLAVMDTLAKALGVDIYVFESYVNKDGKRVYLSDRGEKNAPNGFYDPSDGSIHIDLNAGQTGKGTMLFTVAHELTHFIKDWSGVKYRALADALVKQYRKQGVSVAELVDNQIAKAEQNGREITREEAFDEVVADSMESMLSDENAAAFLEKLAKLDKGLKEKVVTWLKELAGKLKEALSAYKDVKPDSVEGKMVAEMEDFRKEIMGIYTSALVDAGENFRQNGGEKNTTREGGVKMQIRQQGFMDQTEIRAVQSIGRKSISSLTSSELTKLERFAKPYWDSMGVKSPFFRAWFGDWRANDKTPIQVATEKGNSRGVQINNDTGWNINVSGKVFAESQHFARKNTAAIPYLEYINDIVKKAVLLDSNTIGKQKSANSLLIHSLYAVADIGNGPEILKLYVEEMFDPNSDLTAKRAYQLQNIEKASAVNGGVQGKAPSSLAITANAIHTVADLFSAVKQRDDKFSPKDVGAVVNADGTPKVMYHGSKAQFDTFDRRKARSSGTFGRGFYFSDSQSHAGTYGNLYAVYLNIRNPVQYGKNSVTKDQIRQFLEAVADNEDYSIENYGTYDIDEILKNVMGGKSKADAFRVLQDINVTAIGDMVEAVELFNEVNGTDYDGIVTQTETVAFRPTQVKSATDNIGTFDQDNPNIYFSDRDPTAEETRSALERANEKLKEDLEDLRELNRLQGRATGSTVMKMSSVEAAARYLNKYAGSKADVKELTGMLTEFYSFVSTDRELSWDAVMEKAMPIARYLQDNVQIKPQVSDYARDVMQAVRGSKITLDEKQRAEVEHLYGSYEAFRRAAFGTVTFVKEGGIPLDSKWQELAELFPGTFDGEISSNDQPQALLDAIDALKNSDMSVVEYAYNREGIAQDLAVAVYDSFWRADALVTVADKYQKKINQLRGKHAAKVSEIRESRDNAIRELKKKRAEAVKKVREDYKQKLSDQAEYYRQSRAKAVDSRNRTQMRGKIRKVVRELNKLFTRGTKERNVKEGMRDVVAGALASAEVLFTEFYSTEDMIRNGVGVTLTEKESKNLNRAKDILYELDNIPAALTEEGMAEWLNREQKLKQELSTVKTKLKDVFTRERTRMEETTAASILTELADAYQKLQGAEESYIRDAYDENVHGKLLEIVKDFGGAKAYDMSLKQLQELYDAYKMVLTTVRNANRSFLNERAGTIEQQAARCDSEVSAVWSKKKEGETEVGRWLRGFHYRNLKPIYLMRAIGSQTLTDAYNKLRSGEDTWSRDIEGGRSFYLENARKYGYREWDFKKTTTFDDDSGGKVKLTLGQILSLYAYSKRDAAAEHMRIGGVVPEGDAVKVNKLGIKVKYRVNDATSHQLGPETIGRIIGTLSKEQRSFVDAMQGYLSTVMAGKGNEVSMAMYGIKLFNEESYFPIQSAKQFVAQKNEAVGEMKLKNSGFTNKTAPQANNPMALRDFMDVWAGHVNDMSNYHAFVLAIEDFNRILNYQTGRKEGTAPVALKQTIQSYMGEEAVSAVRELIQDFNGGARVDPAAGFVSKAINKFKKNAVFASMSVVIQQPSAIVRATALIDAKYFAGRKIDREKVGPTWEIIKKYAPVAAIKDMGYFDTNMGKATVDYIKGPEHDGIRDVLTGIVKREDGSFDELLSMAPGYADKVTWCAIWEAVKRETAAKNPKLATRSEEFLQKCGDRFTEVITQTQVYDSVFARSGNMRSKDKLMGMATSFMAEPTTSINMIFDAVVQATRGNGKYAARAIGAVFGAAVLNAVLKSIVYAARDDDEDESVGEKYLSALTAALKDDVLFLVPNSIPFVRDIMSLAQGYSVERTDMTLADDIIRAIRKCYSDEVSSKDKVLGIAASVGNLFLPAKNLIRAGEALWNSTYGWWTAESSTAMGLRNAAREGWSGKTVSNARQLYEARMAGDDAHEARVAARYESQDSADAAVVSEIRSAFLDGGLTEEEARKHLILYGNTNAGDAYWKVREWAYARDNGTTDGYGKYNDLYDTILSGGDIQEAVAEFTDNGYERDDVMSTVKTQVGKWYYDDESETVITREQAQQILESYFDLKPAEVTEQLLQWDMKKETGISYGNLKEAFLDGEVSEQDALSYLRKYGGLTEYDAKERVADWLFEQEHGYAYDDIKSTYLDGEITRQEAMDVMTEIGGKSRDEAEEKLRYWDYYQKTGVDYERKATLYRSGIITRQQLKQALMEVGDYSAQDAETQAEAYDWQNSGLQGASFSRVEKWHEYCEGAGVSKAMWLEIALFSAATKNDVDENGDSIRYSAMKKVMAKIDALPISSAQKTAIARAIGWSEKNIARYKPW